MRAIVVGAGLAGLAAADALAAGGFEVTVFEARDRVGGRVWSRTLDDGSVVELGGEFVLPPDDVVRRTARRLGLPLYEKGTLYGDREPRPPVAREELLAGIARIGGARDGTIRSALEGLGLSPPVLEAIAARVEVSTGYPAHEQPASVLASSGAGFGPFPSHGVAGGNQRLALAFARHLRVELSAPVERVAWSDDGVHVRANGAEHEAEACVIAVPAYVELVFDPPLPERKRRALAAVRYGHAAKLFLPLAEPAEPSAVLSVPGRFWAYTQRGPDGSALPVLSAFAGSPLGVESLTPEAVRELRPDLTFADAEPVRSEWPEGAYSVRLLESPLDDEALAEPVGPLAFAGEHTAGEWHALMEGALRSGERAARDLI